MTVYEGNHNGHLWTLYSFVQQIRIELDFYIPVNGKKWVIGILGKVKTVPMAVAFCGFESFQ